MQTEERPDQLRISEGGEQPLLMFPLPPVVLHFSYPEATDRVHAAVEVSGSTRSRGEIGSIDVFGPWGSGGWVDGGRGVLGGAALAARDKTAPSLLPPSYDPQGLPPGALAFSNHPRMHKRKSQGADQSQ